METLSDNNEGEPARSISPSEQARTLRRFQFQVTGADIVAGIALLISIITATVQFTSALRGPIVSALPLKTGFFYWDGNDKGAVMSLAVRTTLLNSASADQGDIVEDAAIILHPAKLSAVRFPFQSIVQAHLSDASQDLANRCDVSDRCLALNRLVIRDQGDPLISLPGASARQDYLSFALVKYLCTGSQNDCGLFADFASTARALDGRRMSFDLSLTFHNARTSVFWRGRALSLMLHCELSAPFDGTGIQHRQWADFDCVPTL